MDNLYVSVEELNEYLKVKLDDDFYLNNVFLKAEISNFTKHNSGHLYFTLKDATSQISAVMFASNAYKLNSIPKNGDLVVVSGNVSVYKTSGRYQLYVKTLELAGVGDILEQLEMLKKKLQIEGIFDKQKKLTIPKIPTKIALITSAKTAAFEDVYNTLNSRFPLVEIDLYDTLVQGELASKSIVKRIEEANINNDADLIILSRGGGSIEDLWCFNSEELARAVANSKIPIITGVGHEIDYTLVDFASCLRALTPTDAAQKAVPDVKILIEEIDKSKLYVKNIMHNKISNLEKVIDTIKKSKYIIEPTSLVERKNTEITHLQKLLESYSPIENFKRKEAELNINKEKLTLAFKNVNDSLSKLLVSNIALLEVVSPLNVIKRGYGLISINDKVISSVIEVKKNDLLDIELADGIISCTVDEVKENGKI